VVISKSNSHVGWFPLFCRRVLYGAIVNSCRFFHV